MKTALITSTIAAAAFAVALMLSSCEGLTLTVNPDGSIGGSYTPPVIAPVK